jgi:hypothetical protein
MAPLLRGKTPRITWGAGFANGLVFDRALDLARPYPVDVEGSEGATGADGSAAGWSYRERFVLAGTVRRIPRVDTAGVTGWEGATGWDAFLAWARDANAFRFIPDAGALGVFWLCRLVSPREGPHGEEINRMKTLDLVIRKVDNTPFEGY